MWGRMVFDEVDTGVSGRAAQKVAEKMARISRRKQVLCVTHLPQLAAMADTHFSVEKGERGGRTYTAGAAAGQRAAAAGVGAAHRRQRMCPRPCWTGQRSCWYRRRNSGRSCSCFSQHENSG